MATVRRIGPMGDTSWDDNTSPIAPLVVGTATNWWPYILIGVALYLMIFSGGSERAYPKSPRAKLTAGIALP